MKMVYSPVHVPASTPYEIRNPGEKPVTVYYQIIEEGETLDGFTDLETCLKGPKKRGRPKKNVNG